MSLGACPEIGLRDARTWRDEARALLVKGVNPRGYREKECQSVYLVAEHTFEAVYEKWLKHRGLSLKDGRQRTLTDPAHLRQGRSAGIAQAVDLLRHSYRPARNHRPHRAAQGAAPAARSPQPLAASMGR